MLVALRGSYGHRVPGGITQGAVRANGVEVAYLECGSGPLALCLHGFPDSAHTWRHLLPALADAGFRAVAPFQRGYAPSEVPKDGRYQTGVLALDAIALHEVLGGDGDAVIIGHDWGAPATYGAASHEPERWSKVVGMAVPPGAAVAQAFLTNLEQLKRVLVHVLLPAPAGRSRGAGQRSRLHRRLWRDWSPGFDATEELAAREVVACAIRPTCRPRSATTGPRSATGYVDPALADVQAATQAVPTQPTLYLHGADDGCIGVEVAEAARPMVADERARSRSSTAPATSCTSNSRRS